MVPPSVPLVEKVLSGTFLNNFMEDQCTLGLSDFNTKITKLSEVSVDKSFKHKNMQQYKIV